jgi:hypothetical protein
MNQWQLPGIFLGLLSSGCGKTNKLNLNYPFPKHPQPYSILCLSMTMYCHQHSYVQKLQMKVLVLIWMETKLIVKKKSSCWVSQ